MTVLEAKALTLRRAGATLAENASFTLRPGAFTAILGPNGAGKTTLLRLALGLAAPTSGEARIDGREARTLPAPERARAIAYLPQTRPLAWPAPVRQIVALGRFAHGAALERPGPADAAAIERALAACDLSALAERPADTLSGGELARVHIARALAAEAPLLVADEPAAALDPLHQHRVLTLLRQFVDQGGGALVVLHDLDLAGLYADRLIWMQAGRIVADGPTAETLTSERIAAVHGVRAATMAEGARVRVRVEGPC